MDRRRVRIRNPKLYRVVKFLVNKGLPIFFILFVIFYFVVGYQL